MDTDEERERRGPPIYSAAAFDNLHDSERDRFFLDVTDNMATDSEAGGDSEADDAFDSVRLPSNVKTSTPKARSSASSSVETEGNMGETAPFFNLDDIFYSDDTEKDPNYCPYEQNNRKPWTIRSRKTLFD